jgi:transposase
MLKNPQDLTGEQRTTLAAIAKTNNRLYRAYLAAYSQAFLGMVRL